MGNDRRWFENLVVACTAQRVGGISKGLAIKGKGALVFDINDDTGKPHCIKIPISLFLPGLKMCLLSPQHWAQEVGDNYPLPHGTRMENNAHSCVLWWGQGKFLKMIPFDPATNTPIFCTSPSTLSYHVFVNTFIACEAPFFRREHVLQLLGRRWLAGVAPPPKKFIGKENLNYDKSKKRASEGVVLTDNETVPTANLPPPPELAPHPDILRCAALTYDPSPVLNEDNEYSVSAPDNQAELMRWHYCLGHALFTSLHQLARNGEIPTKLANVQPPRCAGCLFGAMTKVPWRTKAQRDDSHAVFAATKPGSASPSTTCNQLSRGFTPRQRARLPRHATRTRQSLSTTICVSSLFTL
jgi:hypothetical protein